MKINKLFSTATEYLDSHENMSGLLQVAQRLSEIQKACQSILPRHFSACSVFKLESGKMIIGVPNQSIAARIRQQIPYLQAELGKAGWPVDSIRLKVQLAQKRFSEIPITKKTLSPKAYESLVDLYSSLEKTKQNDRLTSALSELTKPISKNPDKTEKILPLQAGSHSSVDCSKSECGASCSVVNVTISYASGCASNARISWLLSA